MIRASNSGASNVSKRVPFTVPAVPTGMNTGVSINERRVCNNPTRASPSCATTCQLIAVLLMQSFSKWIEMKPRNHTNQHEQELILLRVGSCDFVVNLCLL